MTDSKSSRLVTTVAVCVLFLLTSPHAQHVTDPACQASDSLLNDEEALSDTVIPANIDTLMMRAVFNNNFRETVYYLDRGADIEFRSWYMEKTPLLAVSMYRNCDSLFYELLRRGANPFAIDDSGNNALHHVAKYGEPKFIGTLLKLGLDPDSRNYARQTPLCFAAEANKLEAVEFLIHAGADIEAKDRTGHTALVYAWYSYPFQPIFFEGPDHYNKEELKYWGAPECFEALINLGADFSVISFKGFLPIVKLAEYDNPAFMEMAVLNGAVLTDTTSRDSPLHISASFNNCGNIQFLLDAGLDPDLPNTVGDTPLIVAARRGSFDAVKLLVKAGADIDYLPPPIPLPDFFIGGHRIIRQSRPLFWALNNNHREIVFYLLDLGANPNHQYVYSNPLLLTAVSRQDTAMVEALIAHSADPNVQNSDGLSPLEEALHIGNIHIAKILREAGAPFDVHTTVTRGRDRMTGLPLLHRVAAQKDAEATLWLLENGANVNELDFLSQTAAFHAVYHNQPEILEHLIDFNIDLNVVNRHGETAIHVAARQGAEEALQCLLDHGIDPNSITAGGATPMLIVYNNAYRNNDSIDIKEEQEKRKRMALALMRADTSLQSNLKWQDYLVLAIYKNNPVLAKFAIDQGADTKVLDVNNSNYLHIFARNNCQGWVVKLFADYGVDPNAVNNENETPLRRAIINRYPPDSTYQNTLLEVGADINFTPPNTRPLLISAIEEFSALEHVDWLLRHGSSVEMLEKAGWSTLWYTVSTRQGRVAQLLFNAGANPNMGTLLHTAALHNYFDMVRLLLEFGSDPNKTDDSGNTPLHVAAKSKYPNEGGWCVEALLQAGADVNAKNNEGLTPLDVAKKEGCEHVRELLITAGGK